MSLTRNLATTMLAEMHKRGWHPCLMVAVDWPGAPVYAHSGAGNILFDGQTWRGIGAYGRVQIPGERMNSAARRVALTLYGPTDELFEQLDGNARGRVGSVYFATVTEPGGATLIGTPALLSRGTVDVASFTVSAVDPDGVLSVQSALQVLLVSGPGLRRNASQYHTQEDHNANFSATDTAGRHNQTAEASSILRQWPE